MGMPWAGESVTRMQWNHSVDAMGTRGEILQEFSANAMGVL